VEQLKLRLHLNTILKKTRKYGNQWELFSHSHELVAMILNDLTSLGWNCITTAAGGANEVSVYHSFILVTDSKGGFTSNPNVPLGDTTNNPPPTHSGIVEEKKNGSRH